MSDKKSLLNRNFVLVNIIALASLSPAATKCPHDGIGFAIDDGQEHAGRAVRDTSALFPFLQGTDIQTETVGEPLPAETQALANCDNPIGGRIVDDPARKLHFAAPMGKNLS